MSVNIEPAYLRFIYDGLEKGSIHPENPADLPDGLIGLYDEAFDERFSVVERERLLRRFAIWALLKKAVSAAFVAEVLSDNEDEIQDFISTYSAWFNSPESGKYQLYHERLKVYLLQMNSENEVWDLNEKILDTCNNSLNGDVSNYSFQFLSTHYWIAHFIRTTDLRIKSHLLDGEFTLKQFTFLNDYELVYDNFKMGLRFFGQQNDNEFLFSLLKQFELLNDLEQKSIEEINERALFNYDGVIRIKRFLLRQDLSGESYFKFSLNLLSDSIISDSKIELILFMISEVRDHLESHEIDLDDYVSFLSLIILIEHNEEISESILFLIDYIRDFSFVSKFSGQSELEDWIPFEDKKAFNLLKEKHFRRIFQIKVTHLPSEYFWMKFLYLWGELSQVQKELAIRFIDKEHTLYLLGNIKVFFDHPQFFDLLSACCRKQNDLSHLLTKNFIKFIVEARISNKRKAISIISIFKYYERLSYTVQVYTDLKNLFAIHYSRIRSRAHKLEVIFSFETFEYCEKIINLGLKQNDKLLFSFLSQDTEYITGVLVDLRIDYYPRFNLLGISRYVLFNALVNNLANVKSSVLIRAYGAVILDLNISSDALDLSKLDTFQMKDIELYKVVTNQNSDALFFKRISLLSYGPHREIAALLFLNQIGNIDIDEYLNVSFIDIERSKYILSNSILLKQFGLLRISRSLIIRDQMPMQSALSLSKTLGDQWIKGLTEFGNFLISNPSYVFVDEDLVIDYINKYKPLFCESVFDDWFVKSQYIIDEFDRYLFIKRIFTWECIAISQLDLSKWIGRIDLMEDDYWRNSMYQTYIEYLLDTHQIIDAKNIYKGKLDCDEFTNYPRICTWQKFVNYEIMIGNNYEAFNLFIEQSRFPNPLYFPSEDELKVEICLGFNRAEDIGNYVLFYRTYLNFNSFQNQKTFEDLTILFDTIEVGKDIIECLLYFLDGSSILNLEQVFKVILVAYRKQIVLERLREIQDAHKRNLLINYLFNDLSKDDIADIPLSSWFIEVPEPISLGKLTKIYS